MAQRFISLDEAAQQLGVSKDRLSELREAGKVRGYRDGASWKFRSDDIDKLGKEGLPSASESDISLPPVDDDLPPKGETVDELPDIQFGDLDDQELALPVGDDELASASDILNVEDLDEPTVPADVAEETGDSPNLSIEDDDSESVLLSENEFGDSDDRPPSTIIGKVDLDPASDLDLVLDSEQAAPGSGVSDVRLAASSSDADVLASSGSSRSTFDTDSKSQFSDIEELELDLEAESSRVLSSEVAMAAKRAAADESQGEGDLDLASSSSAAGLTGLSSLELDEGDSPSGKSAGVGESHVGVGEESDLALSGISALELEDDSDVLGEGSDITLSSQDSGINLISPSDSGLALDDSLSDLGTSAISSSLDLGTADDVISLEASDDDEGGEDFLLTPITEETGEGDDESSSQVIALDEVSEDVGAEALLGRDEDMMGDDFGVGGLAAAGAPASVSMVADEQFSTGAIVGLACSALLLSLCGIMMIDLVRNIWSWNEPYALNSTLIDAILGIFPS